MSPVIPIDFVLDFEANAALLKPIEELAQSLQIVNNWSYENYSDVHVFLFNGG